MFENFKKGAKVMVEDFKMEKNEVNEETNNIDKVSDEKKNVIPKIFIGLGVLTVGLLVGKRMKHRNDETVSDGEMNTDTVDMPEE